MGQCYTLAHPAVLEYSSDTISEPKTETIKEDFQSLQQKLVVSHVFAWHHYCKLKELILLMKELKNSYKKSYNSAILEKYNNNYKKCCVTLIAYNIEMMRCFQFKNKMAALTNAALTNADAELKITHTDQIKKMRRLMFKEYERLQP